MKKTSLTRRAALVLFATALTGGAWSQTPTPGTQPNVTLKWLAALSFSPTTVKYGTTVRGTVTLLRAAVNPLQVNLSVPGAVTHEGGVYELHGALFPSTVTVRAGAGQATFDVSFIPTVTWTGTKTISVTAVYGSEKRSASFTVNR